MANAEQLRVVVAGAGYFGQFHLDGWKRIEGARPVASMDLDVDRAKATCLPAYGNFDAMLDETRPDIVDIVTPSETHFAYIRRALEARPRAVVCQKPFCANPEEAKKAAELGRTAGIPVVVHENFRFQPWYRTIREAIDSGLVGQVHQMVFRLRPGDGQGERAYLDRQPYFRKMPRFLVRETGVHWIDTFRFLLGEPEAVFADLRRMNPAIAGEDAGHILFRFADGARALFDGNRHLDHAALNTRCTMGEALVEGTGGALSLAGDGSVSLRRFGSMDAETVLPPSDWTGFGGDCVRALQAHVVEFLHGGAPLENVAEDYLKVVAAEEAVYDSHEAGRWVAVRDVPREGAC